MKKLLCEDEVLWRDALELLWSTDVDEAFSLARRSCHPDARWFCDLFPNGITDANTAKRICLEDHANEGRSLCFAALFDRSDESLLLRAAQLGNGFATGLVARCRFGEERLEWAKRGAVLGDRYCLRLLSEVERDETKALGLLKEAVRLGDSEAMFKFASLFLDKQSACYWKMRAKKAKQTGRGTLGFWTEAAQILEGFVTNGEFPQIIFCLGRIFHGQIDNNERTIFEMRQEDFHFNVAERIVWFYCSACDKARQEVVTWILCAKKFCLQKDVRKLIAKQVWRNRKLGLSCVR